MTKKLRVENAELRAAYQQASDDCDAYCAEVIDTEAALEAVRALGIRAARIGKEIAVKHEDDAWLTELRDIEKDLMLKGPARS